MNVIALNTCLLLFKYYEIISISYLNACPLPLKSGNIFLMLLYPVELQRGYLKYKVFCGSICFYFSVLGFEPGEKDKRRTLFPSI